MLTQDSVGQSKEDLALSVLREVRPGLCFGTRKAGVQGSGLTLETVEGALVTGGLMWRWEQGRTQDYLPDPNSGRLLKEGRRNEALRHAATRVSLVSTVLSQNATPKDQTVPATTHSKCAVETRVRAQKDELC